MECVYICVCNAFYCLHGGAGAKLYSKLLMPFFVSWCDVLCCVFLLL